MVSFPDSLKGKIQLTINFGNAILDVNESNPFQITYILSLQGKSIDSLIISGTVWIMRPASSITIGLCKSQGLIGYE